MLRPASFARPLGFVLASCTATACVFDFSRTDALGPGEVTGTAVDADGEPIAFARTTVEGLLLPARADASGRFRARLTGGVFVLRITDDVDGDGRVERGALRAVNIGTAEIGGVTRLVGVELGRVVLEGTGAVSGGVKDEAGDDIDADVVIVRGTAGLGDGAGFTVGAEAARALPAEARVRARAGEPFVLAGVVPGEVVVVALATTAAGDTLVSAPLAVTIPPEGTVDTGVLVVRPPPTPNVDVTLETVSTVAPADDELLDVSLVDAAGVSAALGTAPLPGAQVYSVPVGRYDVLATSSVRPDELGAALRGQLALPGDPPLWGPLIAVPGAICGAPTDRDADGLPALPAPDDDVDAWVACAPDCSEAFGGGAAFSTCLVDGTTYDCDDDGDLQPDVTEPIACVSLCSSTDADGDGLCDDVDDDPRCALVDQALVCIGDDAFVRPGVRPEYLDDEEPPPEPCETDDDCTPADSGVIHLCDGATLLCAGTGVPVPTAPAATAFHGTGGWGAGSELAPRRHHAMTSAGFADPAGFEIYLFGGLAEHGVLGDLQGWDATTATWTEIIAAGPGARARHALGFDALRQVLVLVGGETLAVQDGQTVVTALHDVWEFDLASATWSEGAAFAESEAGAALVVDTDDAGLPSLLYILPDGRTLFRYDASAGFLPVAVTVQDEPETHVDIAAAEGASDPVVFVGAHLDDTGESMVTHYELISSSPISAEWRARGSFDVVVPGRRTGVAIATSPEGLHVFGGDLQLDAGSPQRARSNELWRFDGEAWTLDVGAETPADLPAPRANAAMAFDGTHLVIVGGDEGPTDDTNATLRLVDSTGPTWTRMPALPVEPSRTGAAFAFDALGENVVVLGGRAVDGSLLDDAWAFSRESLSWRALAAGPSARVDAAAAYDQERNVLVLHGGEDADGVALADLWELDVTAGTWVERDDVANVPARKRHALAFDESRGFVVIMAGDDGNGPVADVVDYTGNAMVTNAPLPSARASLAATYTFNSNAGGGGVAVYGGVDEAGTVLGDLCELDAPAGAWSCATVALPDGPREGAGMTYDHFRGTIVFFGGRDVNGNARNDLWQVVNVAVPEALELAATFVLPAPRVRPIFVSDEQGLFVGPGVP